MKQPEAFWKIEYKHSADRRKHRHRCQSCRKIVQPSEIVFMARVKSGRWSKQKTQVLHETCAEKLVVDQEHGLGIHYTELDSLEFKGMKYLENLGWPKAELWIKERTKELDTKRRELNAAKIDLISPYLEVLSDSELKAIRGSRWSVKDRLWTDAPVNPPIAFVNDDGLRVNRNVWDLAINTEQLKRLDEEIDNNEPAPRGHAGAGEESDQTY